MFKRVSWKSIFRTSDGSPQSRDTQRKAIRVQRPLQGTESFRPSSERVLRESDAIRRQLHHSSRLLTFHENDGNVPQFGSPEEAVADPGLTVELDLSENVVGFRGREKELLVMEEILQNHINATSRAMKTRQLKRHSAGDGKHSHNQQIKNAHPLSVVLVTGSLGTGKTSLINRWVALQQHKILFGHGKFHQCPKSCKGPYRVLLDALQVVIQGILQAGHDENATFLRQQVLTSLRNNLTPSQQSCMQDLLPELKNLLDGFTEQHGMVYKNGDAEIRQLARHKVNCFVKSVGSSASNQGMSLFEIGDKLEEVERLPIDTGVGQEQHLAYQLTRVRLSLRSLICALAETNLPLVLFLDDMQWADSQAIDAITDLFMDPTWTAELDAEQNGSIDTDPNGSTSEAQKENDCYINASATSRPIQRIKNLIFVGAYRIEETGEKIIMQREGARSALATESPVCPAAPQIHWLDKLSPKPAVRIHLDQLDFEDTHQIINSALRLESERTKGLADVVYRKTNGNPCFVLSYLEMLHRERLLFYSFSTYQWQWNLDLIQTETNVTDNVVDLLIRHIGQLPEEIQAVLRLASCLGFYFDIVVLREICLREGILSFARSNSRFNCRAMKAKIECEQLEQESLSLQNRLDLETPKRLASHYDPIIWVVEQRENETFCAAWLVYVLGRAEREGLIERASNKQYKFSHDRVQRCLYEATPSGTLRDMLHLRIGRLIRDSHLTNLDEDDTRMQSAMLYFAVEQLNMASSYIEDVTERIGLIELNLEASDKAGEHLTFLAAARFLRKALSLLQDEDWDDRYELCLEVYSAVAEVEHSCGNSVAALRVVDAVMIKARCFDDKMRVLFIKVNDLGVQGRLVDAIREGCAALEHLGEPLSRKLGSMDSLRDIYQTNKALKSLSKSQLLSLPEMTDPSKIAAMRLLNSLSLFAWHAAEESLLTVIFLRMMSITISYGQNQWTPFAFSTFAMLLAAHGDASTATEFGQLAMEMLHRSKSLVALPRTHLIIYTFVNHIRQPLLHGVEPLLSAHRIGLESGELEFGSLALSSYASLYVIFGLPLPNFSADMRTISKQLHHYRQKVALAALLPWWQFGMNLMGESADVLELTGEAMVEESFERDAAGKAAERTLNFIRLMLSFLFDELDAANIMYEKLRPWQKATLTGTHYINHFQHCYCGLLNMSMARKTGKSKFKKKAKVHLSELERLVKGGAVNCRAMFMILKAEEYALSGNKAKAQEMYNLAISRCARSGFIHLQAITNERAGFYNLEKGDSYWAETYLSRALRNYFEWGAHAKVQNLLEKCRVLGLSLDFSADSLGHAVSLKGRTRFKATPLRLRACFQG